ncbi:hypothetical protein McanCB49686_004467 [Microsporum canis]
MDDGKEVIAKIPNPNAGRAHFVTSSEVATMDFVRNRLHIPAPNVYAWCSDASRSTVGAEYIIMEKVPGAQLSRFWDEMEVMQKSKVVANIVRFEKSLAQNPFCEYGSLYYSDGDTANKRGFTVGPTNNRKYFDDGRSSLVLDRGPWSSAEEYIIANAKRERESIGALGPSPRLQGIFNGLGQYQPSEAAKLHALDLYLTLSHYLLPKNKEAGKAVLWHPDLHTDNIFVDPRDPTKITGVIDWQAVHIAPLFLQVRRPAFLDFDGPIPERLKLPRLPENFDELSLEEQVCAKRLRNKQALYVLYKIELLQQYRTAESALHKAERIKQRENLQKWQEGVELMNDVVQSLGVYSGWDGFVSHDEYDAMRQRVRESRDAFLRRMAGSDEAKREQWRKVWPFPVS